ncbi:hypothetical protein E2C01_052173 [Portunus trituberculatus]|uniref:Uncharacterized protein n=1 Tax=Portunus trituberculatus TaxID=210409 RepID=A0A5B7GMB6_PORTR|nr:hypothetical protein [Portunus trituberculatus]
MAAPALLNARAASCRVFLVKFSLYYVYGRWSCRDRLPTTAIQVQSGSRSIGVPRLQCETASMVYISMGSMLERLSVFVATLEDPCLLEIDFFTCVGASLDL